MYEHIDEWPMCSFMAVVCDGDMKGIYRSNSIPKRRNETIEQDRYIFLYTQYVERINGKCDGIYENYKRYVSAQAKICILEAALMLTLRGKLNEDVVKCLRRLSVRLTDDAEKNILILTGARESATRELNKAKETMESEKTVERSDRTHYQSILAGMSSHFKYGISARNITVGEFCSLYIQMKQEVKQIERINNGRKNK